MPESESVLAARLAYLELPVGDIEGSITFFAAAFGWDITRFAPSYAGTVGQGTDLGLDGDPQQAGSAPLAGIEVSDLEAALAAVVGAGGVVTRSIFAFPGGRRFHFREPSGNELSVFVYEQNGGVAG
ncbi:MAG: VOC family protein [Sphingomonadaceae bacterium]|nr:VOC family protein [Sphingomonadaceae bacterium]